MGGSVIGKGLGGKGAVGREGGGSEGGQTMQMRSARQWSGFTDNYDHAHHGGRGL